ncbi:hypothetical protein O0L34_g7326 [Tuta absoluta]|nr:hypothetical protein O0L34_g7326 [Tuta absoluta]
MKFLGVIVFVSTVVAAWSAALAPGAYENALWNQYQEYEQYLRDRRSSYPGAYYAPPPCAAAAPLYHPAPLHIAPIHHAPAYPPAIPAYGGYPQYRDTEEGEMMGFSDMDQMQDMSQQFEQQQFSHMPMGRYAYGAPAPLPVLPAYGGAAASAAAALAGINAAAAAAAPAGPAIGVFPNANVGGCSVPLLLSCSPSIKSGHIVKQHYGSYGGDSYRGVDDHQLHEEPTHEQLAPAHDATSTPLHQ